MVVISICSGKGGVGKTTVSVNLSVSLSLFGRVLVIDGDIALPNLHTFFGIDDPFISLLDVLKDTSYLKDAIHRMRVKMGNESIGELHILPSSASVKALEEINVENFKEIVDDLRGKYDFVVVDVAAGLSKYAIIPMLISDVSYLVVNPERASIMDSQKVKKIAEISGVRVGGVIVNRYRGEKGMVDYAEKVIGREVVGIIRESKLLRSCCEDGTPVTMKKPSSNVSREFFNLARRIVGDDVKVKPYGKLKYYLG
ncbi:MAG: hypothetical protein DRP01_05075 [Archaeoglobales archaeon]|nr:MAG: hypothetical protein DRP01_05075 [Archaeoglobales archaeon]